MSRALAVAGFAWRANARSWLTRGGLAAGLTVVLIGPSISLLRGSGWALDTELAFYGFLIALIFGVRSGLAEQRQGDAHTLLLHNFVSPIPYAVGLIAALLVGWAAIGVGAFVALLLVTGGDVPTAAWHSWAWSLRSLVLLGLVPLVERLTPFRLPFLLPAMGYLMTLLVLSVAVGEVRATELLIVLRRDDPATVLALLLQAVTIFAATTSAFLLLTVLEDRRRHRRTELVPPHGGDPVRARAHR